MFDTITGTVPKMQYAFFKQRNTNEIRFKLTYVKKIDFL